MSSKKNKKATPPNLKSSSGSGFTFEDRVAATFLCEMLRGHHSLGSAFGVVRKLERQAGDWEPFGDLLLETTNDQGEVIHCGGSVKSNRPVNSNGCSGVINGGMWKIIRGEIFSIEQDRLIICSAPLSAAVGDQVASLSKQARTLEPQRLDQKIVHNNARKIYDSFRKPGSSGNEGLPGVLLSKLLLREFDFDSSVSRSEGEAITMCGDILSREHRSDDSAKALWIAICELSQNLRIAGGRLSRSELSARLRTRFALEDDPFDGHSWSLIRKISSEAREEIRSSLVGDISVPRVSERKALQDALETSRGCYVIGESGMGKSSLVKNFTVEAEAAGSEVVWIRAERLTQLRSTLPDFIEVLERSRRQSAILVLDALEGCLTLESLNSVCRLLEELVLKNTSIWRVVLTCQASDWNRISGFFSSRLPNYLLVAKRIDCGILSKEDLDLVCAASTSVNRLVAEPKVRLILSTLKMLDVLLSGQHNENLLIAGEADLVEWWWNQQVRGYKQIASEERVARELAILMANELCSELPPSSVAGAEEAASNLMGNHVLLRTADGLLRFEHELLADWARVIHLRGLGEQSINFIRAHTKNPPWLRAIRIFSQHLLDRAADIDRWRGILNQCRPDQGSSRDPSAECLQIADTWLDGVMFSPSSEEILTRLQDDLFAQEGWLLSRLLRRLILIGTEPDPVVEEQFRDVNPKLAASAAMKYRLPVWPIWRPILRFLISNAEDATNTVAEEISEVAEIWNRLEDYTAVNWKALANLVILAAEKELRNEIAGGYRRRSKSRSLTDENSPRAAIYTGALYAAHQFPERVAKISGKAAGIHDWDDEDVSADADPGWTGKWERVRSIVNFGPEVDDPVQSWPDGPVRNISRDFFHAWFEGTACLKTFRNNPQIACDITLAFLISWPKYSLRSDDRHSSSVKHYGFNFEADRMYPPFYSKGPFLHFLRENWSYGLDLVIRLINFATDRYVDWWPYEPTETYTIPFNGSNVEWQGNGQVYGWSCFNMNTVGAVTSALMATEKWLEERIEKKESISSAIDLLFSKGKSVAIAGVLIAVGKRHPEIFLNELKPLLFVRELYMLDMHNVMQGVGFGGWMYDSDYLNQLRQEWGTLPGRKIGLLDLSVNWFVYNESFQPALTEVSETWREHAANLPDDSPDRIPILRWASNFDLNNWKRVEKPDGTIEMHLVRPPELTDQAETKNQLRKQSLFSIPYQCSEWLEKRVPLNAAQLESIWNQLHDWGEFEKASFVDNEDEMASSLRDHRHARSALIAVIFCLGDEWLNAAPDRRFWLEEELLKIVNDPPQYKAFSPADTHDDYEGFAAQSSVACWFDSEDPEYWRGAVFFFVAAFRYRTIQRLVSEAFIRRKKSAGKFHELEGLILAFSRVRRESNKGLGESNSTLVRSWFEKWSPKFIDGKGPKWESDWAKIELKTKFRKEQEPHQFVNRTRKLVRRNFGLDMGVLIAAYGCLPPLGEATNKSERKHWLNICSQMLSCYLRTLPPDGGEPSEEEWRFDAWEDDRQILRIVAARILECTANEQKEFWQPILMLPPAAHHHVTQFLSTILIESLKRECAADREFMALWRAMIEFLLRSPRWIESRFHRGDEVWNYLFLYGGTTSSVMNKEYAPLVSSLSDLYEKRFLSMKENPHEQSSVASFLVSEAGEQLLVPALGWLRSSWADASSYFWEEVAETGSFENLLRRAWEKYYARIRQNPETLQAFKLLTLNLASRQIASAVEIQRLMAPT